MPPKACQTESSTTPNTAEAEHIIRSCSSNVTSGETIELILRRPGGARRLRKRRFHERDQYGHPAGTAGSDTR